VMMDVLPTPPVPYTESEPLCKTIITTRYTILVSSNSV
jgi:hypothetical protein